MSGYYSRKLYDECYQDELKSASIGEGNYMLLPSQHANEPCFIGNNVVAYKDNWFNPYSINDIGNNVNIESHLKCIDLADSKCLQGRTMGEMNAYANHLKSKLKPRSKNCTKKIEPSFTRMDDPVINVRSMTTSRFDFPIINPLSTVYYGMTDEQTGDTRFGTNTRLEARDMDPMVYYEKIKSKNGF